MSTREEIETRKAKRKFKLVVDNSPIKLIDIKASLVEEEGEIILAQDLAIKHKDLNCLICSGLYNLKYSSTNDKFVLFLRKPISSANIKQQVIHHSVVHHSHDVNFEYFTNNWIPNAKEN